jgi:hypothetical protein
MRVKQSLSVVLIAAFLVGIGLAFAQPVQAGFKAGIRGPKDDFKRELDVLLAQLRLWNNECIIHVDAEISSIIKKILEARRMITVGQAWLGRRVQQEIESAITEKNLLIGIMEGFCTELLFLMEEELGKLFGKLENLCFDEKIDEWLCNKIKLKLQVIELKIEDIQLEWITMEEKLEDGDEGEDLDDPETFDDVNDWLEFCLENQWPDDPEQCKESLGVAYAILQDFVVEKKEIVKKKKQVLRFLTEIRKIFRISRLPRPRESEPIAFKGLMTARAEQATIRLMTLEGRPVFTVTGSGTLALPTRALAQGVYLAIVEVREAGRVISTRVEKVVISR